MPAAPSRPRVLLLTVLAMLSFAGNSLLCRQALKHTAIDPATFTWIRIASGALVLALLVAWRTRSLRPAGSWPSAAALFVYAIAFSFAYVNLTAATGALLLFGAVQATMLSAGFRRGERLRPVQTAGLLVALAGLVSLLLPGVAAPSLAGAALMLSAGIAWGVYSLRGRGGDDATQATAGNFIRAVPMALLVGVVALPWARFDTAGVLYAVASGVLTSGIGYAIWYSALPGLRAVEAATVQLSVPVIAAIGGVLLLGEALPWRTVVASIAVLGGIASVILTAVPTRPAATPARSGD